MHYRPFVAALAAAIVLTFPAIADDLKLVVVDAEAKSSEDIGPAMVLVRLSQDSARDFALFTLENEKKQIRIMIDGEVRLTPFIQSPISGDAFPISGIDSLDEAADIAERLRTGQSVITVAPHE